MIRRTNCELNWIDCESLVSRHRHLFASFVEHTATVGKMCPEMDKRMEIGIVFYRERPLFHSLALFCFKYGHLDIHIQWQCVLLPCFVRYVIRDNVFGYKLVYAYGTHSEGLPLPQSYSQTICAQLLLLIVHSNRNKQNRSVQITRSKRSSLRISAKWYGHTLTVSTMIAASPTTDNHCALANNIWNLFDTFFIYSHSI